MKLDFLVPILTDFRSIFKSMIDNGESNGINLVTTYSCNLNCNYCFEGQNKDKRIIKDISKYNEIWKYILPKITNPFSIAFFGGEPTLNKDSIYFFTNKIREYSKKKKTKYYLKMITNGTLIDKDFVNFFKPNEFSHIQLTFDGNKKRHNEVRGYYDKIIDSIKEI
ncbi:MAG: radical SAM protein, partial [archaeon]